MSWACAVEASSSRAMSGSDGRYMSVVSGPIALNAASKAVSAKVPGRSMMNFRAGIAPQTRFTGTSRVFMPGSTGYARP